MEHSASHRAIHEIDTIKVHRYHQLFIQYEALPDVIAHHAYFMAYIYVLFA